MVGIKSRRELALLLSRAPSFPRAVRELEQYVTDGDTASEILWEAYMRGDIEGKVVADLGCGTGVLAIGSLLLGASDVLCIDIDTEAVRLADEWARRLRLSERLHSLTAVIPNISLRGVDTVIMNPPFGIHRRGADMLFLKCAYSFAPQAIYTMHMANYGTRKLIMDTALRKGYRALILNTRNILIPQLFESHKRRVYRVSIDLYFIRKSGR
ncbi:MAG: hypothetical protein DRO12_00760 [Thermoprotei archaeon]|nr:MAG: hypothetical protein DRO12_00760 [Thermoprotei archaeon]